MKQSTLQRFFDEYGVVNYNCFACTVNDASSRILINVESEQYASFHVIFNEIYCLLFTCMFGFLHLIFPKLYGTGNCISGIMNASGMAQRARVNWVYLCQSITVIVSVAPTQIIPCTDKLTTCDEYLLDLCINEFYRLWREDNCRKFCGICSGIKEDCNDNKTFTIIGRFYSSLDSRE